MTRLRMACGLMGVLLFVPRIALGAGPVQRYTLVVGANFGGADRAELQYAISDAERFSRVMVDLGGVAPGNDIVLRQPKLRDLTEALDRLSERIVQAQRAAGAAGGRTEVIVYYSGHADEKGLLLGEDRYSYRTLRDRLDQIPADVRIAVLDACASGAFTRIKGGRARPAFIVDESSDMRGHAFLTSSAATEVAQESDRIRASYFTHYLLSAFRGAADISGDGKLTLNEAYQFAFTETLGRTVNTRGGAQHPSYDINLSGTGDVVMTDVRQTTATVVLGAELEGRFFVRDAKQDLVVELYKPHGRRVELGVEPGKYEIRLERDKAALVTNTEIADGGRIELGRGQFGPTVMEPTRRRGDAEHPRYAVAGRNRFELRTGMWSSNGGVSDLTVSTRGNLVSFNSAGADVFGGIQYTRYVSEQLAVTVAIDAFAVDLFSSVSGGSVVSDTVGGLSAPIGIRWNPLPADMRRSPVKPFVMAGIGPIIGASNSSFVGGGTVSSRTATHATAGGPIGGGVDLHLSRWFSLGLSAGYTWMFDFSEPLGGHDNFSGAHVAFGMGFLWGKGHP